MSEKLKQLKSKASAGRISMESQEGSWSLNQPLMARSDNEKQNENQISIKWANRECRKMLWLHLFMIILYTSAFFTATGLWKSQNSRQQYFAYSPASKAVQYQKVAYNGKLHEINPYRGDPRPELDKAWRDLLRNSNIRISKEELQRMNRTSIELYDGSGYHGQLNAYHHLHCLKYLRQVLHSDYYTDVNTPDRDYHVDHCVDDLRQALMCHADTSIVTYDWRPHWRRPWANFLVDHTCVDWDALDHWAEERSFSIFDQKSLVHPELGIIYPDINGSFEDISHGPGMHIVWPKDGK